MRANDTEERVGEGYGDGRMPKWLYLIWLIFIIWGVIYLVRFAIPSLKEWLSNPPVEQGR